MKFDNTVMIKTIGTINAQAQALKTAGNSLIADLTQDLKTFEGDTKDAVLEMIGISESGKENTLAYLVENQVVDALKSLSDLLEANRSTIENADKAFADQLRGK